MYIIQKRIHIYKSLFCFWAFHFWKYQENSANTKDVIGLSEAVNQKKAYTTITKRKITKPQTMIDVILHRKLKTEKQKVKVKGKIYLGLKISR